MDGWMNERTDSELSQGGSARAGIRGTCLETAEKGGGGSENVRYLALGGRACDDAGSAGAETSHVLGRGSEGALAGGADDLK